MTVVLYNDTITGIFYTIWPIFNQLIQIFSLKVLKSTYNFVLEGFFRSVLPLLLNKGVVLIEPINQIQIESVASCLNSWLIKNSAALSWFWIIHSHLRTKNLHCRYFYIFLLIILLTCGLRLPIPSSTERINHLKSN